MKYVAIFACCALVWTGTDITSGVGAETDGNQENQTSNGTLFACPVNRFGDECERECHCMSGTCESVDSENSTKVICKEGCERGWLGPACDVERIKPEVKYYCLKTDTYSHIQTNHILISVKTNGIEHILLHSETVYGENTCYPVSSWQSKAMPTPDNPGERITTLRSDVDHRSYGRTGQETHQCQFLSSSDGEYAWRLSVQESYGVTLENDVDVTLKCNFSKAESSIMKDIYSVERIPEITKELPMKPFSIEDDVKLTMLDASTGQEVIKADLGSPVKLRVTFGFTEGSMVKAVRPRRCRAMAVDKPQKTIGFTSSAGCPTSVVPEFKKVSDHVMETSWFPLFNIPGEEDMQITCYFDFCFEESDCASLCTDTHRVRRSTGRTRHDVSKITSATTHVIQVI